MASSIVALGHAGLDVRLGSTRVVCDPWLSGSGAGAGAYLGSRHPFPRNDALRAAALHDTPNLFLSSPRPEHFDVETLRGFPRAVRVLVPAFPSRALTDELSALGFSNVVALPDGERFELGGGARATVLHGTPRHELAATLVLEAGGDVIADQNDCLLDRAALARLAALRPALHFRSFAGRSHFPGSYDFPPDAMAGHVAAETARLLGQFLAEVAGVGARYVVPMGPACFLDEEGFPLNCGDSVFLDTEALVARVAAEAPGLAERLRPLHPGDAACGVGADWSFASRRPYADKRAYLAAYRADRAAGVAARLAALRARAAPLDAEALTRQMRIYFHNLFRFDDATWDMDELVRVALRDGPSLWLDFRARPMRTRLACDEPAAYTLTLDTVWMTLLMQRQVTWTELMLGNKVRFRRDPDRESPGLRRHLETAHDEALFALVRQESPELVTVEDETHAYVCQKYCPHEGRSLAHAPVAGGVLTCTAHGWRFDLREGGKCLQGGRTPLAVKALRSRK
jgi:UDP-MurNAc hydroxylase